VPVKINVEKPYAVSNIIPLNLEVKVKGKGWSLLRLFTSLKLEFNYDLNYTNNMRYVIDVKQFLNENVGLGQNLSITYVNPDTLYVQLGKYEEKYFKILPNINVLCSQGYQTVGVPVIEPDSIKVGGSALILSKLNNIFTSEITYSGVNANINDIVRISDSLSNILRFFREEVGVHIKVELAAEKELQKVELKIPDLPQDYDVLLIPQNINIELKGGVKQLSEIDNNKILAIIDYKTILADTTGAVVPRFVLPEGMKVISYKPDKIQYVIKKK